MNNTGVYMVIFFKFVVSNIDCGFNLKNIEAILNCTHNLYVSSKYKKPQFFIWKLSFYNHLNSHYYNIA